MLWFHLLRSIDRLLCSSNGMTSRCFCGRCRTTVLKVAFIRLQVEGANACTFSARCPVCCRDKDIKLDSCLLSSWVNLLWLKDRKFSLISSLSLLMRLYIWLLVAQAATCARAVITSPEPISGHQFSACSASASLKDGLHLSANFEREYNKALEQYPPYFDPLTGLKNQHSNVKRYKNKADIPLHDHLHDLACTRGDRRKVQFYALAHGQSKSVCNANVISFFPNLTDPSSFSL